MIELYRKSLIFFWALFVSILVGGIPSIGFWHGTSVVAPSVNVPPAIPSSSPAINTQAIATLTASASPTSWSIISCSGCTNFFALDNSGNLTVTPTGASGITATAYSLVVTASNTAGPSAQATIPIQFYADGLNGAPVNGIFVSASLLNGYHSGGGGSGRAKTNGFQPPWNVAGVDYAVGYPTGQSFTDPSTSPPACASYASNIVTVNSTPCVFNGFDFSLHTGICLRVAAAVIDGGLVTVTNSKFSAGAGCNPAGTALLTVLNGACVDLTVTNSYFDGQGATFTNPSALITVNATHAGCASTLTLKYNALLNSPQHHFEVGSAGNSTTIVQFNYIADGGLASGAHGDHFYIGAGSGAMTFTGDFNTLYQSTAVNSVGAAPTVTAMCYISTAGASVTSASCSNDTYISSLVGGNVTVADQARIDSGGTVNTVNFLNNWFDPTGSFSPFSGNANVLPGPVTCTGNKSMKTAAAITGTFGITGHTWTCS